MSKRAIGREMDRYEIDSRIVETIVTKPQVTIDGIAKETGLSYTAVRNSIQRLVNLGVVVETTETEGPTRRGRPATYFQIDKGLQLFIPPRQFQHLATTIIEQLISEEGPEHVVGLLDRAATQQVERFFVEWEKSKTRPKTLADMVQFICDHINGQGCFAKHQAFSKGFYIYVGNCIYHGISTTYPGTICRYHESLITHLIHAHDKSLHITHDEAIAEGAHNCQYTITRD
ncbi:MAG: helix-turn-helix transcriptional regulator [Promethearchaeota archaeon]